MKRSESCLLLSEVSHTVVPLGETRHHNVCKGLTSSLVSRGSGREVLFLFISFLLVLPKRALLSVWKYLSADGAHLRPWSFPTGTLGFGNTAFPRYVAGREGHHLSGMCLGGVMAAGEYGRAVDEKTG